MKKWTRKEAAQAAIYTLPILALIASCWWWIEKPTPLAWGFMILSSFLGGYLAPKLAQKIGGAA